MCSILLSLQIIICPLLLPSFIHESWHYFNGSVEGALTINIHILKLIGIGLSVLQTFVNKLIDCTARGASLCRN